jgi:cobalt-zinc-cadmium resistance protein CzcA
LDSQTTINGSKGGVAEVESSFGGKLKQYGSAINRISLHTGLQLSCFTALEKKQKILVVHMLKRWNCLYIRSEGLIGNIKTLKVLQLKDLMQKHHFFIRDVATIQIGFATRYSAMTYNDGR